MRTFCVTNCLIGHFGDYEDDLNEALLRASAEFELKIMPHATAPPLALAPCTTSSAHCNPLPLTSIVSVPSSTVRLCCQKHHRSSTELRCGSTGIRATLLTNQIAVFQIGRL